MSWHGIHGHDAVVERFRRALAAGRLASSFLFTGPPGVGKRAFARKLAQALLCQRHAEAELDPCNACAACAQVAAGTHPDLDELSKPADKSFIPVELLIGDKDHRGRQGLCHNLSLKPYMGGRKIAILDDADYLNVEGANSLLKTLEEPPPLSVLILIGTSPARQLPTIRSRCQLVRFAPLGAATVAALLVEHGLVADRATAEAAAAHGDGSLQRALELTDAALWEFRQRFVEQLARRPVDSVALAKEVLSFVDAAGKEAPPRRRRLRQLVELAAESFRQELRRAPGGPASLQTARCLDACIDALARIDRNANQSTLVEAWLDEVATLSGLS